MLFQALFRRFGYGALALGISCWAGWWLAPPPPVWQLETQPRYTGVAPVPYPLPLRQTFTAAHPGLSAVTILPVVFGKTSVPLTLHLEDALGWSATASLSVQHNAPARLVFPPRVDSDEQVYTLTVQAVSSDSASVWYLGLAGEASGLYQGEKVVPGALKLTTEYTLTSAVIIKHLARIVKPISLRWLAAWLTLLAPGLLVLNLLGINTRWWLTRLGLALAISLSVATFLWFGAAWLSARWAPESLRWFYSAIGIIVAGQSVFRAWRNRFAFSLPNQTTLVVLGLIGVGWALRQIAAIPLILPAWVDSVHHYTLARLIAQAGNIPITYEPVLPVANLTYHPGIYPVFVTFQWLSGATLAEAFLWLGQLLNALVALAMAAAACLLTGQPRVAFGATWAVAIVSLFPAYYLSWGRYSQLIGLILLIVILGLAWQLSLRRWWSGALILAGLLGALALIHYRVMIFAMFALGTLFFLIPLTAQSRLFYTGMLALVLAAPWLWHLTEPWFVRLMTNPALLAASNNYNAFPLDYFVSPLQSLWLWAAVGVAVAAWLSRAHSVQWLGLWVLMTFGVLNLGPGSWLVNNNSWVISLFVPGALALGWGLHTLSLAIQRRLQARAFTRLSGLLIGWLFFGVLGVATSHGIATQLNVLNPTTVLARADDARLLQWVETNLPRTAYVAVSSWRWQNTAWSGSDAGAWLWPLWGIRTTAPPLDYVYEPKWRETVNSLNQQLNDLSDAEQAYSFFKQNGITHILIGARGGNLKPDMFVNAPGYKLLYSNSVAWVFEIEP